MKAYNGPSNPIVLVDYSDSAFFDSGVRVYRCRLDVPDLSFEEHHEELNKKLSTIEAPGLRQISIINSKGHIKISAIYEDGSAVAQTIESQLKQVLGSITHLMVE